jgi:hypothetical protein
VIYGKPKSWKKSCSFIKPHPIFEGLCSPEEVFDIASSLCDFVQFEEIATSSDLTIAPSFS